MIEILRQMILGVTAAAILSAVLLEFTQQSALREVVRLAAGMALILALLTPLSRLHMPSLTGWLDGARQQVARQTEQAQAQNDAIAQTSVGGAVSDYLAGQAAERGIDCTMRVSFAEDGDGTLRIGGVEARACAALTPVQREALSGLIEEACGLTREQITITEAG